MGQLIRSSSETAIQWIVSFKPMFKKIGESMVLFIIFCAISESIYTGFDAQIMDIVVMALIVFAIHSITLILVWCLSGYGAIKRAKCSLEIHLKDNELNEGRGVGCFGFDLYDRIAILFCSSQKTLAFGIPIVTSLYESSPDLGIFLVPLLLYYPLMLIMDSFLVQPLSAKVHRLEREMGILESTNSQEISTWTAGNHGDDVST